MRPGPRLQNEFKQSRTRTPRTQISQGQVRGQATERENESNSG